MVEAAASMSIGELARRAGVAVDTLRYYERLGLVAPAGRTKAGYRRFGPEAVERLGFIGRAKSLGFTLADVAELLRLRARPGAPCGAVREKARVQLVVVEQKLEELRRLDPVAALRFASVYKAFEDPEDFEREIQLLGGSDEAPSAATPG